MKHQTNGAKPGPVAPGRIEAPKEKAAGVLPTTATKEQSAASVQVAEFLGNLRAAVARARKMDTRVPHGYELFPAEFLSKKGTAQWVSLIRKAARAGANVDLVKGEFRRRPRYLVQTGDFHRAFDDVESAGRFIDGLGGRDAI